MNLGVLKNLRRFKIYVITLLVFTLLLSIRYIVISTVAIEHGSSTYTLSNGMEFILLIASFVILILCWKECASIRKEPELNEKFKAIQIIIMIIVISTSVLFFALLTTLVIELVLKPKNEFGHVKNKPTVAMMAIHWVFTIGFSVFAAITLHRIIKVERIQTIKSSLI